MCKTDMYRRTTVYCPSPHYMLTGVKGLTGQVCFSEKLRMFSPRASPSWDVKAYTASHTSVFCVALPSAIGKSDVT